MIKKYKIYLLIFPNGKQYCGYTSQTLNHRWDNGNGYKKCPLVYKAIQKYGWENIEKKLIFSSDNQDEAFEKEKEIILKYHLTNTDYGYNLDIGGRPHGAGDHLTDEGRKKISESTKKRWQNPDEREKLMQQILINAENKRGTHLSEETKKKISEAKKGTPPPNRLAVIQLNKDTLEIIAEFPSASDAAKKLIGNVEGCSNILNVCKGKRKAAYGYKWRFK